MPFSEPISTCAKIVPAILYGDGAAGSSAIEGAALDRDNFDHVLIVVMFGTITTGATLSIKAQQGDAADLSDAADITGTSITVADTQSDTIRYLDILRPAKQYLRVYVSIADQNVECAAWYLCYAPHTKPITQPTGVSGEIHKDEVAGTA
jgi:hypothetical protein